MEHEVLGVHMRGEDRLLAACARKRMEGAGRAYGIREEGPRGHDQEDVEVLYLDPLYLDPGSTINKEKDERRKGKNEDRECPE